MPIEFRPLKSRCLSSRLQRLPSSAPSAGRLSRRWWSYQGLFFDEFADDSSWIRETAQVRLPPLEGVSRVILSGRYQPHRDVAGVERGFPRLRVRVDGGFQTVVEAPGDDGGPWRVEIPLPPTTAARGGAVTLQLLDVGWTNTLAWAGRVTGWSNLQRFRAQNRNRQLRIQRLETTHGELIYDFGNRHSPISPTFARKHAQVGLNVVGFLTADLGVGESSRCMVRAAEAAHLPVALIDLKLNVKNRRGDLTYAARLQENASYPVSVFHLDPPAARDIDHHHGHAFRARTYNVGYWAWELPEFPDAWVPYCDYFDEIWCPSDFVREAVALAAPVPVLTMPHAIAFERPQGSVAELRARFKLPVDRLLYLFLYDLNSYTTRKNPEAVVAAFHAAGLDPRKTALVIKTHSTKGNEAELARLQASVADLPNVHIIDETLSRADLYALEAACDVFVSLHRSEGFGLAVAECMYLGKPVISTDWSATAEYVTRENGCPVRAHLIQLEQSVGPYAKGQWWAEPDVQHAAEWMQRLAQEPTLRERLGSAARRTIEERFSPAAIGARYRRRLEAISMR